VKNLFAIGPQPQIYVLGKIGLHYALRLEILLCVVFCDFSYDVFFGLWTNSKRKYATLSIPPVLDFRFLNLEKPFALLATIVTVSLPSAHPFGRWIKSINIRYVGSRCCRSQSVSYAFWISPFSEISIIARPVWCHIYFSPNKYFSKVSHLEHRHPNTGIVEAAQLKLVLEGWYLIVWNSRFVDFGASFLLSVNTGTGRYSW
jgi:hypothetical protein